MFHLQIDSRESFEQSLSIKPSYSGKLHLKQKEGQLIVTNFLDLLIVIEMIFPAGDVAYIGGSTRPLNATFLGNIQT